MIESSAKKQSFGVKKDEEWLEKFVVFFVTSKIIINDDQTRIYLCIWSGEN